MICPSCGFDEISVERRMDGDAICVRCNWRGKPSLCEPRAKKFRTIWTPKFFVDLNFKGMAYRAMQAFESPEMPTGFEIDTWVEKSFYDKLLEENKKLKHRTKGN